MTIYKNHRVFAGVILAMTWMILAGCQTVPSVAVDRDADVDFSTFATFASIKPSHGSGPPPFGPNERKRIVQAVHGAMSILGYEAEPVGAADLGIAVYYDRDVTGDNSVVLGYSTTYWHRRHRHHGHGRQLLPGAGRRHRHAHRDHIAGYHVDTYQAASRVKNEVIVDVVDTVSNELVWRGSSGEVSYGSAKLTTQDIVAQVQKILAHFPSKENRH